jgi:hypothetical protein
VSSKKINFWVFFLLFLKKFSGPEKGFGDAGPAAEDKVGTKPKPGA